MSGETKLCVECGQRMAWDGHGGWHCSDPTCPRFGVRASPPPAVTGEAMNTTARTEAPRDATRAGFDAYGNEVCCWHGHTNCGGCCVAGQCTKHGDSPSHHKSEDALPEYRDGEPYGGLPRVLYRAVMDATSQAVVACMRYHSDRVPTEAWVIDYADVLRKAVATAVRITRAECVVCGETIGYETAVHNRLTGRSEHIACHSSREAECCDDDNNGC